MLRTHLLALGALACLGAAPLTARAAAPTIALDGPAPEFGSAETVWFNHLGQSPDLASLRGRAVLIEFWATW